MSFLQIAPELEISLVAIFGLLIGSLLSLISYRVNSDEPIVIARSKCPHCKKNLTPLNLIPLISWICQKGKCTGCKKKISIRYPLIELSCLAIFLFIYITNYKIIDIQTITLAAIASTLIFMIIVDLEHYYIPDLSQYLLAILVTIFIIVTTGNFDLLSRFQSAFIYVGFGLALWGLFYILVGIEAIGIDDIKFFFTAGFALTIDSFLLFTLLSGLLGVIFGSAWQKITKDEYFPFAPAICVAFFICLIYGEQLNISKWIDNMVF